MTKEDAANRPRDLPSANTSYLSADRDFQRQSDSVPDDLGANTVIDAETASEDSLQANAPELTPGTPLGKYEIRKKLGAGGMGAVYLAFDPMIERDVAVKVLPPEIASRPQALERFLTEARATGKLNHPHVVAIYDIGVQDDLNYIVMEVLRGGNVLDLMQASGTLPWKEACRIVADAADGLAAAHAAGLVHRDIKPENLMMTENHIVKIVDFGLAKLLDAASDTRKAVTRVGQVMGTPQFMSPEQFGGTNIDHRSDIYSLGGTLFQMLTGRFPYENCPTIVQLMYAHLEQPVPDPTEIRADVPAMCSRIISRSMAKSPDDRYQDAAEMARELRSLVYGNPSVVMAGEPVRLEEYRPFESVCIVEPSKMQALILREFLTQSGVPTVRVHDRATGLLDSDADADVVVTSMHVPDVSGIELIRALRRNGRCEQSMLILNSNDSTVEDLVDAGRTGTLALVSKKTRPDELLRAVHACTFLDVPNAVFHSPLDPLNMRVLIITDSVQIPETIAQAIRRVGLLDVQTVSSLDVGSDKRTSGRFDVALVLRSAGDSVGDTQAYAHFMARQTANESLDVAVMAAVQVDGGSATLRALSRGGFTAVTRCPLDDSRLRRILQITS